MHYFQSHVSDPMTVTLKPLMCNRSCTTYVPTQRSPAIEGALLLEGRRLKIRRYPIPVCYFQLSLLSRSSLKSDCNEQSQTFHDHIQQQYEFCLHATLTASQKSQRIVVLHFLHREIILNDIYSINHLESMMRFQCLRYAEDVFLYFCAGLQGSGGTATPQSAGIATGC